MTKKSGYRLSLMIFGLVACLAIPACRTSEEKVSDADEVSTSSVAACEVTQKLKAITIPEMTFRPPANIVDAVNFFNQASKDYDTPETPLEQRGVRFMLCLPRDRFSPEEPINGVIPRIAAMSARFISLYDALNLVCEVTDMKWEVLRERILISPKEQDGGCVSRSYTVPQALSNKLFNERQGSDLDADSNKVWEDFFKQLGAMDEKAKVEYLPVIGKLRVTNTLWNLEVIERVIDQFAERMVEVELQILSFRATDIERLRLSDGISLESLMTLREKGKAKLVATATVLTKSGQEAIMKAVKELVYPTELLADVPLTDSNLTERAAAQTVMPASFATREIGIILPVVPEVSQNGMFINLTLKPQWVTLEGWESYPAYMSGGWMHTSPSVKQPIVGVTSFETQVLVKDGGTVLLGSSSTPDGEWVQVGFLTTRLKNVHPKLSASRTDKIKPRDERKDAEVEKKMRAIVIPEMSFRPPATLIDGFRFLKDASVTYDKAAALQDQRGINMVLKLPTNSWGVTEIDTNGEMVVSQKVTTNAPPICPISARFLTLYDALKLVCDVTGMKFKIRDGIVWIEPLNGPCEGLITRWYLDQELVHDLISKSKIDLNPNVILNDAEKLEEKTKAFFNQKGVSWEIGSSITWVEAIGAFRVTNTPEHLDVLDQVIEDLPFAPRMVEVDVQIHAFPSEEIEKMRLWGDISIDALMTLRRKGKTKPVASATLLTKSGQEGVMKSMREVIYPTELLTDSDQAGSNVIVRSATQTLVPGNFVTRETGMILQFVPEMAMVEYHPIIMTWRDPIWMSLEAPEMPAAEQSQINVTLKPIWIPRETWQSFSADRATGWSHRTIPFKQPVFDVTCFETQVMVKDGETILLGSSVSSDPKWVNVGFLTAKRKRIGRPLEEREEVRRKGSPYNLRP